MCVLCTAHLTTLASGMESMPPGTAISAQTSLCKACTASACAAAKNKLRACKLDQQASHCCKKMPTWAARVTKQECTVLVNTPTACSVFRLASATMKCQYCSTVYTRPCCCNLHKPARVMPAAPHDACHALAMHHWYHHHHCHHQTSSSSA